tara:strand:+ start:8099 stop:9355 length:1257 start_codon:yes stop_codon:yes gene_type:complete
MPVGTPIRLVQESKDVIELNATNMVLTTSRKVGGSALPFSGSRRVGFDLNVNSAMVNIQGVIVDDQVAKGSAAANGLVTFGKKASGFTKWATPTNLREIFEGTTNPRMVIRDFNGNKRNITFTKTTNAGGTAYSSNGGSGSSATVLINPEDATALQVASAVNSFINAQLSTYFSSSLATTINVEAGVNGADTVNNAGVRVVHLVKGVAPNGNTIDFVDTGRLNQPHVVTFAGGANETKKSAGDKVQDLYGIVNNSKTQAGRAVQAGAAAALGIAGLIVAAPIAIGAVGSAAVGAAGSGVALGTTAGLGGVATGIGAGIFGRNKKDYIIGLQIPFNSMLHAEDGTQYTARNFFMPTGLGFGDVSLKGSDGALAAGTEFSEASDSRTGIQGAIQKLDINYDAGETVYNFNIIFAPIDNIL